MMSRLTKKLDEGFYVSNAPCTDDLKNKLGKLEDLEEDLGCTLNVVFKAIKNGLIYFKEDDGWSADFSLDNNGSNWYFDVFDDTNNETSVFLKDYQKTWWLKGDRSE